MNPARFMEEISRWMDKNHDNKVDEKCDGSGKGTKKGRFQIALESASIIYGRWLFDFDVLCSLSFLLRSKLWNLDLEYTISYLC